MLTSCLPVCKVQVLQLKTGIWWNVKTHQLVILLTEPKNILICHAVFYCELFSWVIFFAECEILNFLDVGILTCTASLRGWPLACYQSNGLIPPVMSIFLFKSIIPSIFNFLSIVQKHLAQTCSSITLADSPTFYQMSVFRGKTHNLQMRKYDVSMTSPLAKYI